MSEFRLPDVGEGLHDAELVAWHVSVGDRVVADQPLVSVETAKAVVEIPSPRSGVIAALHGAPGDVIDVGAVLVEYGDGERADAGSVVGSLDAAVALAPPRSEPVAHHPPVALPSGVRATPAVRLRARALGVDLASVTPSGVDGTITRADVEAAAAGVAPPEPIGAVATPTVATPVVPEGMHGELEPLRGVRRAMDANMSRAHSQVVPATVHDEADIGDWADGTDITLRLVRAIAMAAAAEPALNATYLGRDTGRLLSTRVDLGVAVDSPDGLFVPVLRDIGNRTTDDLAGGLAALKDAVRSRSVAPEEMRNPTITLSNFGAVGAGRHASLVVVPPQVAIVGAGRVRDAVVAMRGQAVVTRVLPLSITFDHRVIMGGEATRFLRALIDDLQLAD